jgi:CBS domain-containing protein
MTCETIMTPAPKTLGATETVGAAAQAILAHRAVNLPVVDADNRLVGLFGIYDLFGMLVPRVAVAGDLLSNLRFMSDDLGALHREFAAFADQPVFRAMNREPVTVFRDTPIVEGIRLFCRNHMTLPVVERDNNRLAGLISYWDAARAIVAP